MNNQPNHNGIISRSHFRKLTGLSRSTEWRLTRQGKLPSLVILNGRPLGYLVSDYNSWLQKHAGNGGDHGK